MLQAFFTGLAGLNTYSQSLDTVSNNIANMNTPGYRGTESFFKAIGGEQGQSGLGAEISGQGHRFSVGDIRQTGNEFDVALTGNGFFVLMDDNNTYYTRSGKFDFNQDNVLIDTITGFKVAGIDDEGKLQEINLSNYQAIKPTASTSISLTGNLSPDDDTYQIPNATLINSLGEDVDVSIRFTNEKAIIPNRWRVEVLNDNGNVIHTESLLFGPDGTPSAGQGTFTFDLADSSGNDTPVEVKIGQLGDFSGVTHTNSTGTDSNVSVLKSDGKPTGTLINRSFTDEGVIKLKYSNGDELTPLTLALADFDNIQSLELDSGTIFTASDNASRVLGRAGELRFSKLATKSVENSNVDLSQEFADMLVIQRGYQASSRVLNVANQMIEQLYENTRGR
ncbi:flagellar basal-body rod protein FlgF [Aestuariibacter sp. AA17]|uniref:Flagellar basal-body rod protein FlgF n=1 Tax=Fluctibacter corallii TaxID=2984329 RepID=A0ABT3A9F8_9ALTE|nr:flagellar basal-body rod protein FlgF [Aestuariibacter sp. AA17]MCV2885308.1 flagellar basal-body rod protein FlgF [Aestuariibacter sp. AA17]